MLSNSDVKGENPGDHVAFIQRGNEVVLQPLHQTLKDFRGSVPVSESQDLKAIRQEVLR